MVERLPSMHVPMLVLVGKDDYITPPSQARRLASLAQSARVIEFEHSGHFPFAEEQEAYMKVIRDWLGKLEWSPKVRVAVDVDPYSFL